MLSISTSLRELPLHLEAFSMSANMTKTQKKRMIDSIQAKAGKLMLAMPMRVKEYDDIRKICDRLRKLL